MKTNDNKGGNMEDNTPENLTLLLKRCHEVDGLSDRKLAKLINENAERPVSYKTIQNIRLGKVFDPGLRIANTILHGLGYHSKFFPKDPKGTLIPNE